MLWWEYGLLGSAGGLIVEALSIYLYLAAWASARRTIDGKVKQVGRPLLREYLDVGGHIGIAVARAVLGFASAAVFAGFNELRGGAVAVALGFAGPGLLSRLGDIGESAAAEPTLTSPPANPNEPAKSRELSNPEGGLQEPAND